MSEQGDLQDLLQKLNKIELLQKQMLERQNADPEKSQSKPSEKRKDIWDRLNAIAPILSGTIIAIGGTYFTMAYNQQQLRLQEAQTIEKFIPHLLGDEKSKRAAILAISSLTDPKMAAKVASIFASPGTVSALESLAEHENSVNRKALNSALAKALDNMAETYRIDNRYDDAIAAYKKALDLQEQSLGADNPELLPHLNRMADLFLSHQNYSEAESLLNRASEIQKKACGAESLEYGLQLRKLAKLYKMEGNESKSQSILSMAAAIEQKTADGSGIIKPGAGERERSSNEGGSATNFVPDGSPARTADSPEGRGSGRASDGSSAAAAQSEAANERSPHAAESGSQAPAHAGEIRENRRANEISPPETSVSAAGTEKQQ